MVLTRRWQILTMCANHLERQHIAQMEFQVAEVEPSQLNERF
jgi:hypothetical protein